MLAPALSPLWARLPPTAGLPTVAPQGAFGGRRVRAVTNGRKLRWWANTACVLTIWLAASLPQLAAAATSEPSPQALLDQAQPSIDKGDPGSARPLLERAHRAVAANPATAPAVRAQVALALASCLEDLGLSGDLPQLRAEALPALDALLAAKDPAVLPLLTQWANLARSVEDAQVLIARIQATVQLLAPPEPPPPNDRRLVALRLLIAYGDMATRLGDAESGLQLLRMTTAYVDREPQAQKIDLAWIATKMASAHKELG